MTTSSSSGDVGGKGPLSHAIMSSTSVLHGKPELTTFDDGLRCIDVDSLGFDIDLSFDLPEFVFSEKYCNEELGRMEVVMRSLGSMCDKGHLCNLYQKAKISIKMSQDPDFLKSMICSESKNQISKVLLILQKTIFDLLAF